MTASNTLSNSPLTLEPTLLKQWTVQDYHRMSEVGILSPGERTELLSGQITLMAAKRMPHVTLRLLETTLDTLLANEPVFVITQDTIQLDNFSEPEPDLTIVQGTIQNYVEHHPRLNQVYLVVEVADSTLKQDCEVKDKRYAQDGIADYWVLDLNNYQFHIYREPAPTGYTYHLSLTEPNQASPSAFPKHTLSLTQILSTMT